MITINWGTKVITIPKSYLTLVQTTPVEIYDLPLNQFRLDLKALESTAEGIPHPATHKHNTEVSLGGIVYARVIEIINGYTVTFENGSYAVNLIGANSNVGDRVNLNLVSVRSSNSAGLISNAAIEFSSFAGAVCIKEDSGITGTVFPKGTPQAPVNNVSDAKLIADLRGISIIRVKGNFTFTTGDNLEGFILYGENPNKSLLTFEAGALTQGLDMHDASIQGTFDNEATFLNCRLLDINFVQGFADRCVLAGTFVLSGSGETGFYDCFDGYAQEAVLPIIDCGGAGRNVSIRNYQGDIKLINKTGTEFVEINGNSGGTVTLDSTISNGTVRLTGLLKVEDNSTGTAIIDISEVSFPDVAQYSAFEENSVWLDETSIYSGTKFPTGTSYQPVNNDADARVIAENFAHFNIRVDAAATITSNHQNITFIGRSARNTQLTIQNTSNLSGCEFETMLLTGDLNGNGSAYFTTVAMKDLIGVFGHAEGCVFREGTITLAPNAILMANRCASVSAQDPGGDVPIIDCNGSGRIAMRDFNGEIIIKNKTSGANCSLGLSGAEVTLDSTITSGNWRVFGVGTLIDNSTGSATVDSSALISSSDADVVADAVWNKDLSAITGDNIAGHLLQATKYIEPKIYIDTEAATNGDGSPISPFNNVADAKDFAELKGIQQLVVLSEITLDRNLKNFTIRGIGAPVINCNGQDLRNSVFSQCTMRGTYTDRITVQESVLDNGFVLNGFFENNALKGTITAVDGGDVLLANCFSIVAGLGRPTISMNGIGSSTISIRSYSGGLTITDANNAADAVTIEMSQGKVTLDSTCVAGVISVRGISQFTDNSTGSTVDITGLLEPDNLVAGSLVWTENEKDEALAYSRKASDNAEQANLKL